MPSRKARLDRFISARTGIPRGDVRRLLAQQRVHVDGVAATCIHHVVGPFARVALDGQLLQDHRPVYLMLNKPPGVVSATRDARHKTVIDLLDPALAKDVHIVGRLDFNSSGLLLLTNDGEWSRRLMEPARKVAKVYEVSVEKPICPACIQAFADGMYFPYEGLTTLPAGLELRAEKVARVSLVEGRYHQIKRMFGRFGNRVLTLHRLSVGNLQLDAALAPGQSRELTALEVETIVLEGASG